MKKYFASIAFLCAAFVYAGDVAVFVDKGFSDDGRIYVFAQYGRTDKTFRAWSEIYTVDIAKNIFIKNELYKTEPSRATENKTGYDVYKDLDETHYVAFRKYNLQPTPAEQLLYVATASEKKGTDEISFNDFGSEKKYTYTINLIPTIEGKAKNARSSFFIMLEKKDERGTVLLRKKIGSPDVVRKGVSGYKIEKIFRDKTGTRIVFVVAKTVEDNAGISIRYMVETAALE